MDDYLRSANINVTALLILAFLVVVENLSAVCVFLSYPITRGPIGSLMFLELAKPWGLCFELGFTI